MPKINKAPVKQQMYNGQALANTWNVFFSSLGDALAGDWSNGEYDITISNATYGIASMYVVPHGQLVYVTLSFDYLSTNASTATFPYNVRNGFLTISSGNDIVNKIVNVYDTTMEFPDIDSDEPVIVQGILAINALTA